MSDNSTELLTEWVFIDSCAFHNAGFDWDGPVLSSFKKLCRDGTLHLLTSSIIVREIQPQTRDKIASASTSYEAALRKAINSSRHLDPKRYQTLQLIQKAPDLSDAVNDAEARRREYFENCLATYVDVEKVAISGLLDDYFSGSPPFGDGNKKSEFPDAINIAALYRFAYENKTFIYIVSSDGDLATCCTRDSPFIHFEKLEQLVSIAQAESDTRSAVADQIMDSNASLLKLLEEQFPDRGFYISGSDGDVEDVEVTGCEVWSTYILDRNGDRFEVEVEGKVEFSAVATWTDFERGTYDREDDMWFNLETARTDISETKSFKMIVECSFVNGDLTIESGRLTDPAEIYVSVEEVYD